MIISNWPFTDTDSYVIKVETDDLYEGVKEINKYMGFSDYPPGHPNYDTMKKQTRRYYSLYRIETRGILL